MTDFRWLVRGTSLFALMALSGCLGNPFGSLSSQPANFHPGYNGSAPQVTSVLPVSGSLQGGTLLTIQGTGFQSGDTISVGGVACLNVTFVSATSLTCITPGHDAGSVNVSVTNSSGQTSSLAGAYAYFGMPNPTAGIAQASGGGISTGNGVRLRVTAGAFGNPVEPAGTGVAAKMGLQGTLPHP